MYVLSVQPDVVRRMRPGDIPPAILIVPGTHTAWERCYSVALLGPFAVIYHPADRLANGRSLSIHCSAVQAISAEDAALQLATLEAAAGRPTYVHANTHRARANAAGKPPVPIIAIRRGRSAKPEYTTRVEVAGPGWLVACPQRMLPCSAKVFVVVPFGVVVDAYPTPGAPHATLYP